MGWERPAAVVEELKAERPGEVWAEQTRPGARPVCGVFAGDPIAAHRRGVEFVSEVMLETLDEPVDAVITTSAGYPLDLTFYQAIKGVTAASHIVKSGGKILLLAACEEGAVRVVERLGPGLACHPERAAAHRGQFGAREPRQFDDARDVGGRGRPARLDHVR